jgi:NAD dependent epimerase/dehydratase family enzyme
VTNRDFARALGRALHRPALMPAPAFALRAVFGEMADEMLLNGQRVIPARTTAEGFSFSYPALDGSLEHALHR